MRNSTKKLHLLLLLLIIGATTIVSAQDTEYLYVLQGNMKYGNYLAKVRPYFYYQEAEVYRFDLMLGRKINNNVDLYLYYKTDTKDNNRLGYRADFKYWKKMNAKTQLRYYWGLEDDIADQAYVITTMGYPIKKLRNTRVGFRQHYGKSEGKDASNYVGPSIQIPLIKKTGLYACYMWDVYSEKTMFFGILYFSLNFTKKSETP